MGSQKRAPLAAFTAVTVACLVMLYFALRTQLPLPGPAAIVGAPMKVVRIVGQVVSTEKPAKDTTTPGARQDIQPSPSPTQSAPTQDAATQVSNTRQPANRNAHKTAGHRKHAGRSVHHPGKAKGHAKSHGGKGHQHTKPHAHGKPAKPSIDLPIIGNVPLPTLTADAAPGNSGNAPGRNKESKPGHDGDHGHGHGYGHGHDKVKAALSSLSAVAQAIVGAPAARSTAATAPSHDGPAHETGRQEHGEHGHAPESHGHAHEPHGDSGEHGDGHAHEPYGDSGEHGDAHESHGDSGDHGHAHEPHGHAHEPHGHAHGPHGH